MTPLLSIIIPCYNSDQTLEETLQSVFNLDYKNWEAIIVNDGSPDNVEAIAQNWLKKDKRFKYFKKENGGLGSARNFGVSMAQGSVILPLDSDNKVKQGFISKHIGKFAENEEIGVIYGNAEYFGDKTGLWKVGDFDKIRMLQHNYIDACALINKTVFDDVGLYDEDLPFQGHEDWDFWLRVMATKFEFIYVDELMFEYRVTSNSMIKSFDQMMMDTNIEYVKQKHYKLYESTLHQTLAENRRLKRALNDNVLELVKRTFKKIKK